MTAVLKKCEQCGQYFLTVWERRCDACQMKDPPKVWAKPVEAKKQND